MEYLLFGGKKKKNFLKKGLRQISAPENPPYPHLIPMAFQKPVNLFKRLLDRYLTHAFGRVAVPFPARRALGPRAYDN